VPVTPCRSSPSFPCDADHHVRRGRPSDVPLQPGPQRTRADELVADVYAILSSLSAKRPAALVLDEFQAVPELGPHLPSLLKALADEHPQVSLVLAGSRRHLMEELVLNTGAPLYNMAERHRPRAH